MALFYLSDRIINDAKNFLLSSLIDSDGSHFQFIGQSTAISEQFTVFRVLVGTLLCSEIVTNCAMSIKIECLILTHLYRHHLSEKVAWTVNDLSG